MPLGFGHHSQKDVATEERGRDPFIATGRGGAGNIIRSPSRSRDRSSNAMPAATAVAASAPHVTHSGRGGAGNVRSPSRDPLDRKRAEEAQAREDKLQEEYRQQEKKVPHSTGRGGAGNISQDEPETRGRGRDGASGGGGGGVAGILRSLSRSRSRSPRSSGHDSPGARSGSRVCASEGSRLAQVDESRSSADESTIHDGMSTTNGAGESTAESKGPSFKERLVSHLPGHHN